MCVSGHQYPRAPLVLCPPKTHIKQTSVDAEPVQSRVFIFGFVPLGRRLRFAVDVCGRMAYLAPSLLTLPQPYLRPKNPFSVVKGDRLICP